MHLATCITRFLTKQRNLGPRNVITVGIKFELPRNSEEELELLIKIIQPYGLFFVSSKKQKLEKEKGRGRGKDRYFRISILSLN